MTSNLRSRSRNRLSAFFGRSSSKTRTSDAGVSPVDPVQHSFEATGRNKLLKERNGTISPATAYPPSSFRGPSEAGFSRRMSSSSSTSGISQSPSFDGGNDADTRPRLLSRSSSRQSSIAGSRPASLFSIGSRTSQKSTVSVTPSVAADQEVKKSRRKSWLGLTSRNKSNAQEEVGPTAWVAGDSTKSQYDLTPLTSGERVSEMWDEAGGKLS